MVDTVVLTPRELVLSVFACIERGLHCAFGAVPGHHSAGEEWRSNPFDPVPCRSTLVCCFRVH